MTDRPIGVVTRPVLRAMIDYARSKDYQSGVIGVQARPVWDEPSTFDHHGSSVQIAPCVSALAVREVLLDAASDGWLVVITDRPADDLGDGILAHFIGHRLRWPDEWEALRQRFKATGVDASMQAVPHSRELAGALLAAEPRETWAPAPSGVLTLDHAMSAVFRQLLGVNFQGALPDAQALLAWTGAPGSAKAVADLRAVAGDRLADAALDWFAGRLAVAGPPIRALLSAGQIGDVIPLGVVVDLLTSGNLSVDESRIASEARIRLEPALHGYVPNSQVLRAWADEISALAVSPEALRRADELLAMLHASALAGRSDVLPAGLSIRLTAVADRLRTATTAGTARSGTNPDASMIADDHTAAIERAWALVQRHSAASTDARLAPFAAAVRLVRWLSQPAPQSISLSDAIALHRDHDAWVDVAVNDAASGSGDLVHAAALNTLLEIVRQRRDRHDRVFAAALALATSQDSQPAEIRYIEDVLANDVGPVLAKAPVLLLVLDGMAVSASVEVIGDAIAQGWIERTVGPRRSTALAALPTLTEVSRASLLCGALTVGTQPQESAGVAEFARAVGQTAALFHKKLLDSSRLGFAVSDEVGAAIDDVDGRQLVACVLNTIDDALDRSDPAGTSWTVDAVKHLQPLLERARTAGRVVVLTADHGYVVERRNGAQRSYPDTSSNRSRAATPPAAAGEVLVEGRRVLKHGGRAVLAVDERVRFGPLKAGYHGGATPAEVIVPVLYLVSGPTAHLVDGLLHDAGPQEPWWWDAAAPVRHAPVIPAPIPSIPSGTAQQPLPGLEWEPGVPSRTSETQTSAARSDGLIDAVVGSPVFASQSRLAGRAQPSADQVRAALRALLADPATRQPLSALTAAMGVSSSGRGAFASLQRLLNVEGYPVVDLDSDGVTVILDVDLLSEQFGANR